MLTWNSEKLGTILQLQSILLLFSHKPKLLLAKLNVFYVVFPPVKELQLVVESSVSVPKIRQYLFLYLFIFNIIIILVYVVKNVWHYPLTWKIFLTDAEEPKGLHVRCVRTWHYTSCLYSNMSQQHHPSLYIYIKNRKEKSFVFLLCVCVCLSVCACARA